MALNKIKSSQNKKVHIEDMPDLQQLYLYCVIVNESVGAAMVKLLQNCHTPVQYSEVGKGTAPSKVLDILGVSDIRKKVIFSFLRENQIEDVKREVEAFFAASKKNKGIAFTIQLNSLVGATAYRFLSQSF